MLDDENVINDINPYVVHEFSLPGTMRKTFEFSDFSEKMEEKATFLQDADLKGVPPNKKLVPKRNIDTGFTKESREEKAVNFDDMEYVIYKNTDIRVIFIGTILAMILLISIR